MQVSLKRVIASYFVLAHPLHCRYNRNHYWRLFSRVPKRRPSHYVKEKRITDLLPERQNH